MISIPGLLVFGQFACIAVLLFGGSFELPWWGWVIFCAGLLVFLSAAASLGTTNFTIMPIPRTGSSLSKRGIYTIVRHPMYTAVLICGSAMAFGAPSVWRWAALALCFVVLVLKIRIEEQYLTAIHPDYPVVMKGVSRLFPFIW
ncbi:MAG: isoprenylcysteine carboxylmethyltransferase family protein [Flavobacteriales bacterium]|nr:isoprenylcysteine carboxylmethyltransferase family protein [Flavobacteriales bacterium]